MAFIYPLWRCILCDYFIWKEAGVDFPVTDITEELKAKVRELRVGEYLELKTGEFLTFADGSYWLESCSIGIPYFAAQNCAYFVLDRRGKDGTEEGNRCASYANS